MKRITKIVLKRVADPDADLSWLKTEMEGDRIVSSCRYSDQDVLRYGLDRVRGWIEEDHDRIASYGETWDMVGVFAQATILTSEDGKTWLANSVRSGGLWNIESDSSADYFRQVEAEEVAALRDALIELGFSQGEIDEALAQEPSIRRTRVIVTVRGGVVQAIHSDDPRLDVAVLDWDNAAVDEQAADDAKRLAAEADGLTEVF